MEKSIRQRLLFSLLIFIGMIAVGINSIIRGIEAHQTWRIVLASVSIAMFAAGIVLALVKTRQSQKA